jgi:26S proteasome regulatory subunit N9
LAKSKGILADKIKIMSFAELVFTLPKNERVVSFSQISKTTGIPINLIELMIIKAMSLDLLKGSIDEVKRD